MGVCVPNFRSVSLLVWPGDVTQTNKYIHIQVNLRISSNGCSPHVDFDYPKFWYFGSCPNHYWKKNLLVMIQRLVPSEEWKTKQEGRSSTVHVKFNIQVCLFYAENPCPLVFQIKVISSFSGHFLNIFQLCMNVRIWTRLFVHFGLKLDIVNMIVDILDTWLKTVGNLATFVVSRR